MEPKAQAASPVLRRIGVALKIYALYPPPSSVADRAVAELLDGLRRYIEAYGPLTVRVSKHSLQVDAATFKDLAAANLAYHLYTRKVIGITIALGVTAPEAAVRDRFGWTNRRIAEHYTHALSGDRDEIALTLERIVNGRGGC